MKNYSIAIYGSSLRQSFDIYSDKDLLIVASSYKLLSKLKNKYEEQGYSVSIYTYKKLQYLSNKSSLFIQHLKVESKIIKDNNNQLSFILNNYIEKSPTELEIKESKYFFTFLNMIPKSDTGYAWFCDCFYVGLRNHLILKSAIASNCKFSYIELIYDLHLNNNISNSEFKILKDLRVLKKNYREKIFSEYPTKDYTTQLINIGKKLGLYKKIHFVESEIYFDIIEKKIFQKKLNHYFKLRLFEIYYLLFGQSSEELDYIISNPQFYTLKFKNDKYVKLLIDKMQTNITLQIDFKEARC